MWERLEFMAMDEIYISIAMILLSWVVAGFIWYDPPLGVSLMQIMMYEVYPYYRLM